MSLEDAVKENTLAINELIKALKSTGKPSKKDAETVKPVEEVKMFAGKPVVAPTEEIKKFVESMPDVSYEHVKHATIDLAKKDQDVCIAVLNSFGAKTARDLKPEQYAAYVDATRAKLKEVSLA